MEGRKQEKHKDVEWMERGKELTKIDAIVRAWKRFLPEAFLEQISPILDGFRARCSARADLKARKRKIS